MTAERRAVPREGFRGDIQGLRAIAVGAVLLYHAHLPFITGGYVGVDIFFVISGFLITSHLLRSLVSTGRVGFAEFYARRARRILPASLLVVILTVIGSVIWLPPLQLKAMFQGAIATALYLPNYFFAATGTSYLSETTPSLFQHFWSLGIEEQFYIFWPAVLALGFLLVRRSPRRLAAVVAMLVVVSFALCVLLTRSDQPWAFFSLPTRAWELGVGGLVAFLVNANPRAIRGRAAGIAGWIGLVAIGWVCFSFNENTSFPGYNAAIPVVATALVIIGGAGTRAWSPAGLLSLRPLVFIGMISYSLYLVHWPVLLLTQAAIGERSPLPLWATVALAVACVPIGWLLFTFVENPFRTQKFLAGARPRRTLVAALTASAVIVATCGGGMAVVAQLRLTSGETAPGYVARTSPEGTDFVPVNLRPALEDASEDNPAIYDSGCHLDFDEMSVAGCEVGDSGPTVALFGDSHAAQWYPPLAALAEEGRIRLTSYTKSSCNSVTVDSLLNSEPYPECDTWRQGVIDRLNADPPEVIILANFAREIDVAHGTEDFTSYWASGLRTTITSLPDASQTVVVGETATMGLTPSICLSAHLDDANYCGRAPSAAIDRLSFDAESRVASDTGAAFLDLNPYLCNDRWCPPIIDDTLVYRDDHHLTVTFTTALRDEIWDRLDGLVQT
ncbi:acyltransferase [Herbiconiux sp. CPCC 205716]|uniref:Acyltransferase n=1 Tax=Herbiconiux gentiana TaxID=2970912 RepID=A0ABT2GBY1_9MICO|nr:acyltransferase family protein [Herbiconiux gentiana]MCS5713722.1 acyltransferase [Herbiconiux gentiana]